MRLIKKTTAVAVGAAMIMALGTTSALAGRDGGGGNGGGDEDRALCHYPPGNPDNVQIIDPDDSSYPAHLAHGDEFVDEDGECPDAPGGGNGGGGNGGGGNGGGGNGGDDASCSVSQENESTNSTGNSSQSGLINLNNIALQGLNIGIGNLLCQADILNGLTAAVLGDAVGGDSEGGDDEGCVASQDNDSDNSTGDSSQDGLVNVNNVALQGLNVGVDNLLCQADILNGVTAAVLGTAVGGDADADDDDAEGLFGLLELDILDALVGRF